jgi:aminobenzoyl-glutamate utilization protein B
VRNQPGRALNNFEVEFFGQAAHASGGPWNGRSALDAVEMMNYGVNLMREHVKPTTRIHYVIPNAGEAPNVVPEYAKVWYFVRDENREAVEKWYEWILQIAAGAAMGTRTEHKTFLITGVHEYNLNRPLQEAMQANLELVGPPQFSNQEQEFAKKLQAELKIEQKGYSTEVKPLAEGTTPVQGGSTDVAEVSHIAPTAGLKVATSAAGIPGHSWAATACNGTDAGVKGAVVAAKVMAATGIDLLLNAKLREDAKADFAKRTGGKPYQSPVPPDQPVPLP